MRPQIHQKIDLGPPKDPLGDIMELWANIQEHPGDIWELLGDIFDLLGDKTHPKNTTYVKK